MKEKVSEQDLAAAVVQWLSEQNWTVYQEVVFQHRGGVADIVAKRNGILWIIECKTTYSFKVLQQASAWPVHYRSVAVPSSKDRDYSVALDYYKVGVLEVNVSWKPYSVTETTRPPIFRRHNQSVKKYSTQLDDLLKSYAVAGSRSGYHLTPYKRTMLDVRKVIEQNPGCTVADLWKFLGNMHYASGASFRGNVLDALLSFEKEWCVVDTSVKPCKLYVKESV